MVFAQIPAAIPAPIRALAQQLRRLAALGLALALCLGLAACDGSQGKKPPSISPEDMALIERQAEGFLAARNRLPELAALVNDRNWVFTANLIHGPMQEVGREGEVEKYVQIAISKLGATSMKDMGKVMGIVSKELAGKTDGKTISTLVKKKLML